MDLVSVSEQPLFQIGGCRPGCLDRSFPLDFVQQGAGFPGETFRLPSIPRQGDGQDCFPQPPVHEGHFALYELGHHHIGVSGHGVQTTEDLMTARMSPPRPPQRLACHDRHDIWKRPILNQKEPSLFESC
jgi:hypothetical protein